MTEFVSVKEFQEGAWYWGSDGKKWKVKFVFHGLVIARCQFHLFSEAFFKGEEDCTYGETAFRYVMIYPGCKVN